MAAPYYRAVLRGGVSITEDDLLARGEASDIVFDESAKGGLSLFVVGLGDSEYGVDFDRSEYVLPTGRVPFAAPAAPRLVYYKTMRAGTDGSRSIQRIVVGWQATVKNGDEWRNVREGILLYPQERRWMVGEF